MKEVLDAINSLNQKMVAMQTDITGIKEEMSDMKQILRAVSLRFTLLTGIPFTFYFLRFKSVWPVSPD